MAAPGRKAWKVLQDEGTGWWQESHPGEQGEQMCKSVSSRSRGEGWLTGKKP